MTDILRAKIDEQAFRELVAGKVVRLETPRYGAEIAIEVILEDIGWGRMLDAIANAVAEQLKDKPRDDVLRAVRDAVEGRDGRKTAP
jgi:hypothetical protein